MTYPEAKVVEFINSNFIPLRSNVQENAELNVKYQIVWTPTIVIADSSGTEQHNFTGFLPPEEYLAQLQLGIARIAFNKEDFEKASGEFKKVVETYPKSDAAPEAQYWFAVSEYKLTHSVDALKAAWQELLNKYPDSIWAKKVSFIQK